MGSPPAPPEIVAVERPGSPRAVNGATPASSWAPAIGPRRSIIGGRIHVGLADDHYNMYSHGEFFRHPVPSAAPATLTGPGFGPLDGDLGPVLVWTTLEQIAQAEDDPNVLPRVRVETPGIWHVVLVGAAGGSGNEVASSVRRNMWRWTDPDTDDERRQLLYDRADGDYAAPVGNVLPREGRQIFGRRWTDKFRVEILNPGQLLEVAYQVQIDRYGPPFMINIPIATRWIMWR